MDKHEHPLAKTRKKTGTPTSLRPVRIVSKVSDRVIRREGEIRGAGTGKEEEKIKPVLSADDKIMYLKKKKEPKSKQKL